MTCVAERIGTAALLKSPTPGGFPILPISRVYSSCNTASVRWSTVRVERHCLTDFSFCDKFVGKVAVQVFAGSTSGLSKDLEPLRGLASRVAAALRSGSPRLLMLT